MHVGLVRNCRDCVKATSRYCVDLLTLQQCFDQSTKVENHWPWVQRGTKVRNPSLHPKLDASCIIIKLPPRLDKSIKAKNEKILVFSVTMN